MHRRLQPFLIIASIMISSAIYADDFLDYAKMTMPREVACHLLGGSAAFQAPDYITHGVVQGSYTDVRAARYGKWAGDVPFKSGLQIYHPLGLEYQQYGEHAKIIMTPVMDEDDGNRIKLWVIYRASIEHIPTAYYSTNNRGKWVVNTSVSVPGSNGIPDEKTSRLIARHRQPESKWLNAKFTNRYEPYKASFIKLGYTQLYGQKNKGNFAMKALVYENCRVSAFLTREHIENIIYSQNGEGYPCGSPNSYFSRLDNLDASCLARHFLKNQQMSDFFSTVETIGGFVPILGSAIGLADYKEGQVVGTRSTVRLAATIGSDVLFFAAPLVKGVDGVLRGAKFSAKFGGAGVASAAPNSASRLLGAAAAVEGLSGVAAFSEGDIVGGLGAMVGAGAIGVIHRIAKKGAVKVRSVKKTKEVTSGAPNSCPSPTLKPTRSRRSAGAPPNRIKSRQADDESVFKFTDDDRLKYELEIIPGPNDTIKVAYKHPEMAGLTPQADPAGEFVVTIEGRLFVNTSEVYRAARSANKKLKHSSFTGTPGEKFAKDVAFAGKVKVKDGVVQLKKRDLPNGDSVMSHFDNQSGHYKPNGSQVTSFKKWLRTEKKLTEASVVDVFGDSQ